MYIENSVLTTTMMITDNSFTKLPRRRKPVKNRKPWGDIDSIHGDVVLLSCDKCTHCKSLWIKASAKCPQCKCKCNVNVFNFILLVWNQRWVPAGGRGLSVLCDVISGRSSPVCEGFRCIRGAAGCCHLSAVTCDVLQCLTGALTLSHVVEAAVWCFLCSHFVTDVLIQQLKLI